MGILPFFSTHPRLLQGRIEDAVENGVSAGLCVINRKAPSRRGVAKKLTYISESFALLRLRGEKV
jgi:hypothetical protein